MTWPLASVWLVELAQRIVGVAPGAEIGIVAGDLAAARVVGRGDDVADRIGGLDQVAEGVVGVTAWSCRARR